MKLVHLYQCILLSVVMISVNVVPARCQHNGSGQSTISDNRLVFDLGKIEVVGRDTRTETNAVTVVDAETINRQLHESVVDVSRRLPGLSITVGNKNEPQIMLRGFSQKYLAILYDGVPMASPYYSDLDTSQLPVENIAEIKIVRGNASVLYGPNAMGGVLSIVSAKPGLKPHLNLLGTIDQDGNVSARLAHGQRWGDCFYQVSAGARQSDGWRMSRDYTPRGDSVETGGIRDSSHYDQWSLGAKAGREWENSEMTLALNYQDASKGIPPTTNPDDRVRFWDFTKWRKYSLTLAGRTQIGPSGDLRGNMFYHKYDNVLEAYRDADHQERMWTSTYDDASIGGVLRTGWAIHPDVDLRAVVHGVMDEHNAQDDLGEPWKKYATITSSLAAETEWSVSDNLILQAGASYNLYRFDEANNVEGDNESLKGRTKDVDASGFGFLATVPAADHHVFTMAVSRKNRFPNMHELFSNIVEFDPDEVFSLQPEMSVQYAVGYTYQAGALTTTISNFYYNIKDKIMRPDRDSLYMNIEKATHRGVEFSAEYGNRSGLFGSLSYTFQETENKSPFQPAQSLPYVPKHHIHMNIGYGFESGTQVTVSQTHRRDVVQYDRDGNAIDLPSWTLWDLTVRHEFDFGLGITLKGQNVFDTNYYQEIGYEQPGRTVRLGMQYRI
jgi:iron complex outermembrane recepter protein